MKLPTIHAAGALPQSLNDKIGKLRAATGRAERCAMVLFCSKDGPMPAFTCTFERTHPNGTFKMVPEGQGDGPGQSAAGPAGTASTYNSDQFEPFTAVCPHCHSLGRVRCEGCAKVYCTGAVTEAGGVRQFRCPTCKDVGVLSSSSTVRSVGVLKTTDRPGPAGLLGHIKQGLLPGRK